MRKEAEIWAKGYPKTPDRLYSTEDIEAIAKNSFIEGYSEAIDKAVEEFKRFLDIRGTVEKSSNYLFRKEDFPYWAKDFKMILLEEGTKYPCFEELTGKIMPPDNHGLVLFEEDIKKIEEKLKYGR